MTYKIGFFGILVMSVGLALAAMFSSQWQTSLDYMQSGDFAKMILALPSLMMAGFSVINDVVPWYVRFPLIYVPMGFAVLAMSLSFTRSLLPYEEPVVETIGTSSYNDYWDEYGQRLKDAYAAKFLGRNIGFEQEVDARVAIMNHNGRGFTRTIAQDWLKRMHTFTESK